MSVSRAKLLLQTQRWDFYESGTQAVVKNCPLCSNSNHKFYINVSGEANDGLWDCKVCGQSGNFNQLKQRLGLGMENVVSAKDMAGNGEPQPLPDFDALHNNLMNNPEYGDVLDYLVAERKFSVDVLEKFKVGAWTKEGSQWYVIPYFDNSGNGIYYKSRRFGAVPDKGSRFNSPRGREVGLFNEACVVPNMEVLYVMEGECFTGDTEVLSPNGWVRLDEYKGQQVAQWSSGVASFVTPMAYISKEYSGEMVRHTTKSNSVDLLTTPNHRVLFYNSVTKQQEVRPAKDVPMGRSCFYRSAFLETAGVCLSDDDIRLAVIIQADATLENEGKSKTTNHADGLDGWRMELKKARKIHRAKEILTAAGIEYSEYRLGRGTTLIRFRAPAGKFNKVFGSEFYKMSVAQRAAFSTEIRYWDGHVNKRGRVMYSSVIKANADVVQWAFSMSGVYANTGMYKRIGTRSNIYWVSVSEKLVRGDHCLTSPHIRRSSEQHTGRVYCVQVPSSFIVTRRNGAVCVTGNCDALSMLSNGYDNVVAVPGAGVKKAAWIEKLDNLAPKNIYIILDNDKPGQDGAHELALRIGLDKVKNVLLPDFGGKDINDWFKMGHSKEALDILIEDSKFFDVQGVQALPELLEELRIEIETKGTDPTYDTPWPSLTKRMGGVEAGDLVGILAAPKCGKTTLALNWLQYYADHGIDSLMFCQEMQPRRMVRKWVSMVTRTVDTPGASKITTETIDKAMEYARNMEGDLLFGYTKSCRVDDVVDTIRQTVRRYGIKIVCFDNLQMLVRSLEHAPNEISAITKKFKALCMEMNIAMLLVIQPHRVPDGVIPSARNAMGSSSPEKDVDTMVCAHRNRIAVISKESDFRGFVETSDNFEPQMLVRVDLSRYAPGGQTTLYLDGALSLVREIDDGDMTGAATGFTGVIPTEATPNNI